MDINKTILITGGAGSLGRNLIDILLPLKPTIRVFDNSEYNQWELSSNPCYKDVRLLIGDIRDETRLKRALEGVDYVFHCAALKHIPLCEYNPVDCVQTNIIGSINVINASLDCNVKKVIAISSDKAVHPINIYGASKLVMEKLFTQSGVYGDTLFSCIRFGNFIGSRGSLLRIITRQLEEGEAITLTDREMTRWWITPEEAAKFCLRCLEIMVGGEVFIPKMPQKSVEDFIRDYAPDAEIKIIGKRAGEKLNELLFSEDEKPIDKGDYYIVYSDYFLNNKQI